MLKLKICFMLQIYMYRKLKLFTLVFTVLLSQNINNIFANSDIKRLESIQNKIIEVRNTNIDSTLLYVDSLYYYAVLFNQPDYEYKSMIYRIIALIKNGKHIEALKVCKQTKKFVEDQNLTSHKLEVEMHLANTFLVVGFASEALKRLLNLQQNKNDLSMMNQIDLDFYTGSAYLALGDQEKGMYYVRKSIIKDSIENNFNSSFSSIMFLGNIFQNIDSVKYYYDRAEKILSKNPNWHYQKVGLLNNRALLNEELGNISKSKKQYSMAINLAESSGLKEELANIYNNLVYIMLEEKKFDSAKLIADKALKISKQINSFDLLEVVYDTYCDYLIEIGDYKSAIQYQDSSIIYSDSLRKQKKIKESIFISTIYETEEMEKQLLEKDNRISKLIIGVVSAVSILLISIGLLTIYRQKLKLSRNEINNVIKDKKLELADALIIGQNNERKRIAMDLHDGLSTQISNLKILFEGFFANHKKYQDVHSLISEIYKTTRDLSHRLLPSQLENAGIVAAIASLAKSINEIGDFKMEFETNLVDRLSETLELNLYYLTLELVTNATKHSEGNYIFVQLLKHENMISLQVEDNGNSFYLNTSDGMGINNVKTRVEYLNGRFIMDIEEETVFLIEIPI